MGVPPQEEAEDGGEKAIMDEVDAVVHFRASRAREGLANTEKFLILSSS